MASSTPSKRLCKALGLMAWGAQSLHVGVVVEPALCQRDHVVTLRGEGHTSSSFALDAQRRPLEQRSAHRLQPATGDAFGDVGPLSPRFTLMVSATTFIDCKALAPSETAGTWSCSGHGQK